jgi:hypothetical protein
MSFPTYANGDIIYEGMATSAKVPADRSRLSFVPCPIEWYAGFDTNAIRANLTEGFLTWGKSRAFREHAGNLAVAPPSLFGQDTDIDYNGKFFARNSNVVNSAGAPIAGSVYKNPTSITGLKYDLFIRTKPKQVGPMGVLPCFRSTGGVQEGSNCVGIISARQRVYKSGGGTLSIAIQSVFGVMGFQINVGTNRTMSAGGIGSAAGGLNFTTNTFVQPKTIYDPYWGNASTRIDALGTTSLRVQAWDAWPQALTVFIPQYYVPLHFNPGVLGSKSNVEVFSCDMPTPSKKESPEGEATPQAVGFVVTDQTTDLELIDSRQWDIDTSRRGMLVTGGLKYTERTVGFNKTEAEVRVAGKGYSTGDILENRSQKVQIVVTSITDGGVSGWDFYKDAQDNDLSGSGLSRATFENGGPTLSFPKSGASQTCLIKFKQGVVKEDIKVEGPQLHIPGQLLTPPARGDHGTLGAAPLSITSKSVTLPNNPDAPEPGAFDLFYHFQSDPAANPRNYGLSGVSNGEDIKHVTITVS